LLVQTHALTKRYGSFTALEDFTFDVKQGEVCGLLGPNGAGKTTLLRMLLGFLRPTSGRAEIAGLDSHTRSVDAHKLLAYLPGDPRLFRRLRGLDTLKFFAEVRPGGNFRRAQELADRLELDAGKRVSQMSTGMRQKLALAATMAADVPLLILDEPTSNLDPTIRRTVTKLVAEAQAAGQTIIFSSHVISEVEEVCDRVVLVRRGKLVHTQEMSQLRERHLIRGHLRGPLPTAPAELNGQLSIAAGKNSSVTIETAGELTPLLGWLAKLPLTDVRIEPHGLQAVYDKYHGETATQKSREQVAR
jgi:ABC-2 type transport system ATP-binding protein